MLSKGEIQTTINLYHRRIGNLKRDIRDNKGKREVGPWEYELSTYTSIRSKLFDWMKIIEEVKT